MMHSSVCMTLGDMNNPHASERLLDSRKNIPTGVLAVHRSQHDLRLFDDSKTESRRGEDLVAEDVLRQNSS